MSVKIKDVTEHSPAYCAGVQPGDTLISINQNEICDALDYHFYTKDKKLRLVIDREGKTLKFKVKKDETEDLGLEFETYLMDAEHHCKNKCIFCFIDQLPKGLRETLYFKDDDSRLSFLFGNYITLTNVTRHEIDRIKKMHISPVNISVHTTNPELRVFMMKNPHAGESLQILYELADFGTKINCQIVLCPGINDGEELERTLKDLIGLYPSVQSVAAVPVGLTKHRQGLCELREYDKQTASQVLSVIKEYGDACYEKFGERIVYASDEFYILAQKPLPPMAYYGDFAQLENGVGICRMLIDEFVSAVEGYDTDDQERHLSIVTGKSFYPMMCHLIDKAKKKWHNLECNVYAVQNDFFGHKITVTGLLTGTDIINQLKGKNLGDKLLISSSAFRSERDRMLDDITVEQLEQALGTTIVITENDGYQLLEAILN